MQFQKLRYRVQKRLRHPSGGWRVNSSNMKKGLSTGAMARRPIARQPGTSIAFYRKGSAVVAEITIYLLGLFLAHEWLENLLAIFCFLGEIAHFLKFSSTAHSAEPNNLRLLLPFRGDVLSVVFQKAARWIFWDFRHLNGLLTIRKQRENRPQKSSPVHGAADHLNRGRRDTCKSRYNFGKQLQIQQFVLFLLRWKDRAEPLSPPLLETAFL